MINLCKKFNHNIILSRELSINMAVHVCDISIEHKEIWIWWVYTVSALLMQVLACELDHT